MHFVNDVRTIFFQLVWSVTLTMIALAMVIVGITDVSVIVLHRESFVSMSVSKIWGYKATENVVLA